MSSRDLARKMDGDLTYRHEKGRSIFELTLPTARTATPSQPDAATFVPVA